MKKTGKCILFTFLFALMILQAAQKTEAANMIKAAKTYTRKHKKQVTRGKLKKKGIRITFKLKNGKRVKDTWLYYNGEVYYFKPNGNARRNRFFEYDGKTYFADKNGHVQYGKWIRKGKSYYYLKKNGERAEDETLKFLGRTYVFRENGKLDASKSDCFASNTFLFVGDSRTVGMQQTVGGANNKYIGAVSMGYDWLVRSATPAMNRYLSADPDLNVILCFGVNDLGNIGNYIAYYRQLAKRYPKANFFYMAVNPCSGGYSRLNGQISAFNAQLKKAFGERYIDTYAYLSRHGFASWDGLHYYGPTYQVINQQTVDFVKSYLPVMK